MSKRSEYLKGDLTFHEYYGLLVELLGEGSLRAMLPGERTPDQWRELLADDPHLNNVPLAQWDFPGDGLVRQLVRAADADELVAITGSKGWSLSDSTCVLKETARRYAEQLVCPQCGSENVTPPHGHHLAKCDSCHLAFDTMDDGEGE